jgi:hypothetical protein
MHFNISNLVKRLTKDKRIFKATILYFSILVGQINYILKDPMDGFMSLKIKMIFKSKLKDMSINELFLKNIKVFLKYWNSWDTFSIHSCSSSFFFSISLNG